MNTTELRENEVQERAAELDEDGFLQKAEQWNESVALKLAQTDGMAILTEVHWKVIYFIRVWFEERGSVPPIRTICAESHLSSREFYDLFPAGPVRGACRIAGLPKPAGCV